MHQQLADRRIDLLGREIVISGIDGDMYLAGLSVEGERDFVRFINDFLPDNGFFVDVGANIGLTTLIAATLKPACRLVAIEPAPFIAKLLEESCPERPQCC